MNPEKSEPARAVTHSGKFHADEVMAIALLHATGLLKGLEIARTRDASVIKSAIGRAYILDVGGVHDPENLQFDHHQRGFDEYFNSHAKDLGVRMSSLGLLYSHLGTRVFTQYMDRVTDAYLERVIVDAREAGVITDVRLQAWHEKFYKAYVLEIDANDNGVSELRDGTASGDVYRYQRNWALTGIVYRASCLQYADTGALASDQDAAFRGAVISCAKMLSDALAHFIADELAYETAHAYIENVVATGGPMREYLHCSTMYNSISMKYDANHAQTVFRSADGGGGAILVMHDKFDYYRAAMDVNRIGTQKIEWLFFVLPREDGKTDPETDAWQVHTVQVPGQKFVQKANIITEAHARAAVGDKVTFVHNGRFIGVTQGLEAATQLAFASLYEHYADKTAGKVATREKSMRRMSAVALMIACALAYYAISQVPV